jgi:hypothetical protein
MKALALWQHGKTAGGDGGGFGFDADGRGGDRQCGWEMWSSVQKLFLCLAVKVMLLGGFYPI